MKCPLTKEDCLTEGCAWWDSYEQNCIIITLAIRLDNINGMLDSLDDALRETNKTLITAKQLNYIIGKLATGKR
jgi:hypothetical protein